MILVRITVSLKSVTLKIMTMNGVNMIPRTTTIVVKKLMRVKVALRNSWVSDLLSFVFPSSR